MENSWFIFDWNSFWINIIAGFIFFVFSIVVSIWLIPKYTVRLIRKQNKLYSIIKIGAVIQEFCELLSLSPYRDEILNSEQISVFTKKKDLDNYKFIALCNINVFNEIVFSRMTIVIYNYFKDKNINESYKLISEEHVKLKSFRLEIERILIVHSLHIDDKIIQKISKLCFDIKAHENKYMINAEYDELLKETGTKREGVFGLNELPTIYENLLRLIKELISLNFFEYEIKSTK